MWTRARPPTADERVTPGVEAAPRAELARKLIHVAVSIGAAAVVAWRPAREAAVVLAAATLGALTVEVLRRSSPRFARGFQARVGAMLRAGEAGRLTGATTLSIGYTLAAVLLPGRAALAGILLTGLADAAAAVVGKRFGSIRYPGGKSVQGSAAFFVVAAGIAWAVVGPDPRAILGVAALVTVLEAPSLRMDDNLYLPLAAAGAVRFVAWIAGVEAGGFS